MMQPQINNQITNQVWFWMLYIKTDLNQVLILFRMTSKTLKRTAKAFKIKWIESRKLLKNIKLTNLGKKILSKAMFQSWI